MNARIRGPFSEPAVIRIVLYDPLRHGTVIVAQELVTGPNPKPLLTFSGPIPANAMLGGYIVEAALLAEESLPTFARHRDGFTVAAAP